MRGASKGEGLGNQFLAHIREVDAVAYVLRCFEDDDITHVESRIDPLADAEVVETELMLADLESLEKRAAAAEKKAKGGDKEAKAQLAVMEKALVLLRDGKPARMRRDRAPRRSPIFAGAAAADRRSPSLYVCNVDEAAAANGNAYSQKVEERAKAEGAACVVISAKIEAEVRRPAAEDARNSSPRWASKSRASTA